MIHLTWQQVNGWRMQQHGLLPRFADKAFVPMAERLFGIQAQVMSAAELGLGMRVEGITAQDIQNALWEERTLVKTWGMRGTLHLFSAQDVILLAAARKIDSRRWLNFEKLGLTEAEGSTFVQVVPEILSDVPMTREELGQAVGEAMKKPALGELISQSNWGAPLKYFALRGDLCFAPNRGKHVTFVNPKQWLKHWYDPDPEHTLQDIARRYLRAYAPLTPRMLAHWWNEGHINVAKKLLKQIEDELVTVNVEGWEAVVLHETLEAMQASTVQGEVRLLPMFDAYTLDMVRMGVPLLEPTYRKRIFRNQGWITAIVLVDGFVKGVWNFSKQGKSTIIIEMFDTTLSSMPAIQDGIEAEVQRIGAFLGINTSVTYGTI
jgi:hypothetical protein